jgi:dTDP-4-dehydrorhamnose reductase
MRILVTGASGLLGLNLALEAAKDHQVFGVVHRNSLRTQAFQVIEADLTPQAAPGAVERLLDQAQPDWVIHCAAQANVDACEADPVQAEQLNSLLPEKLAAYVARGGARLLHVSTDAVFDGARGEYSETDEPNPLSVYGHTKLDGERRVAVQDPSAIIARVNLFGWSLGGRRSLAEFFFNNLSAGARVMGFTDVYFCPLLVNDIAVVFLEMLSCGLKGLFHVVSSECLSKYEFGVRLAQTFKLDAGLIRPASVQEASLKAARSPMLTLRTEKLAAALGHPAPDTGSGIHRFYQLYQQGYPQMLRGLSKNR